MSEQKPSVGRIVQYTLTEDDLKCLVNVAESLTDFSES